ncbi:MAG: hypothetical protein ACXVGK_11290 [Mycobacteriaceae bacterium]
MTAVRPLPPEEEAEINGMVAGREARLTIEGELELDSKDVRVTGGSVRFLQRDRAAPPGEAAWLPETEKPLASMRQIEVRDRTRGGFQGLGIGAGIGIVLGAIGGAAVASVCVYPDCGTEGKVLLGAVAGGVGLGLLGAALGAAIGAPRIIEFKDAPSR